MDEMSHRSVAGLGHGHLVELYDSEAVLAATVATFVREGLADGGSALIVATETHCHAFLAALRENGIDVDGMRRDSRLILADAGETLSEFMLATGPDRGRFQQAVNSAMDRAPLSQAPLRVYGEMVAVLWEDGDISSAVALEDLWNELAAEREFALLCAYPTTAFDRPGSADALARVCEQHTKVIDDSQRLVANLQRQSRLLRRKLDRPAPSFSPAVAGDGERREPTLAMWLERAIRHGDAGGASAVLESGLKDGISGTRLLSRVVPAAMHAIGSAWEAGEITVADEHLATATCQRAITWLYPSLLTHRPRSRERLLVAGVEGEMHGLAPRVVADVLEGRGYDVIHCGVDVPADALAEAVKRHAPELVALSLTMPSGVEALERSLAAVQAARPDVLLLLGGQGIAASWARAGFPTADDAEDAVRKVDALLRERPEMPTVARGGAASVPTRALPHDPLQQFTTVTTELSALARENALRAHEYRFLANEDALTGLPNRREFEERLAEVAEFARQGTIMLVDVDELKRINDSDGHGAGDAMLIEVGRAISHELRAGDVVARLGGDEFGVLFVHGDEFDVEAVATRMLAGVQQRCAPRDASISIGIASCDGDPAEALRRADRALYEAKGQGRNTLRHA
jgi:diguanylate cyclase (GGDEF)-like protein